MTTTTTTTTSGTDHTCSKNSPESSMEKKSDNTGSSNMISECSTTTTTTTPFDNDCDNNGIDTNNNCSSNNISRGGGNSNNDSNNNGWNRSAYRSPEEFRRIQNDMIHPQQQEHNINDIINTMNQDNGTVTSTTPPTASCSDSIDYRGVGGPYLQYLWCREKKEKDYTNRTKSKSKKNTTSATTTTSNDDEISLSLLRGQTLYLGSEINEEYGPDQIFHIPGHATQVLVVNRKTDVCTLLGPLLLGKYKWLRGIASNEYIYGLPCRADTVLCINVRTMEIQLLPIPYEEFYNNPLIQKEIQTQLFQQQQDQQQPQQLPELSIPDIIRMERECEWKYHGGSISPVDLHIYCIPQSASHVLRINTITNQCEFVGPTLVGKYKWYGGTVSHIDEALYAIPHNSPSVLRILPLRQKSVSSTLSSSQGEHDSHGDVPSGEVQITLHGDFRKERTTITQSSDTITTTSTSTKINHGREHLWHGAATAPNGTIVCVPANADCVLCIYPPQPSSSSFSSSLDEPELVLLGNVVDCIQYPGRHRTDRKYKYLGATPCSYNGKVYCFPCAAEHVLEIDPIRRIIKEIGPNLYPMERICQNKYQNGVYLPNYNVILGIPLAAETILCIDFNNQTKKKHNNNNNNDTEVNDDDDDDDDLEPIVTVWPLPEPYRLLGKFEGAIATSDDNIVYCVPNCHKAVLRIEMPSMINKQKTTIEQPTQLQQNKEKEKEEEQHPIANGSRCNTSSTVEETDPSTSNNTSNDTERHTSNGNTNNENKNNNNPQSNHDNNGKDRKNNSNNENNKVLHQKENFATNDINPENLIDNPQSPMIQTKVVTATADDEDDENSSSLLYLSGIPTLRSSSHRVKFNPKLRLHDPNPKNRHGISTGTTWLPSDLLGFDILSYDRQLYESLHEAIVSLLLRCNNPDVIGTFRSDNTNTLTNATTTTSASRTEPYRLEDFTVPVKSLWRTVNGGQCEMAQQHLSDAVSDDVALLQIFDRIVQEAVVPYLKQKLGCSENADDDDCQLKSEQGPITFYYQRPPTIRLQPGPARARVKPHNDAEYGHQNGELNFWLPLTDRSLTGVDLYCESQYNMEDYQPIEAKPSEMIVFHGSSCRHYVNTNKTSNTRVSIDFRIGVQGYFDPHWQMKGTSDDHGRKEFTL